MLEGHWPGPIDLTFQSSVSIPTLENFYFYSRKIWIIDFSFHSRNSRPEFQISHSTLEIRDQNLKFLFLLSKFEIRISNFSFYSRNSRSESRISLSTLKIRDANFKFLFLLLNLLFWLSSMPATRQPRYLCLKNKFRQNDYPLFGHSRIWQSNVIQFGHGCELIVCSFVLDIK